MKRVYEAYRRAGTKAFKNSKNWDDFDTLPEEWKFFFTCLSEEIFNKREQT